MITNPLPQQIATMLQQEHMVHALCIEGQPQQALELAQAVAGAVLCGQPRNGQMCGECLQCRKVLAGVHSDLCMPQPEAGGYKKDAVRALRAEIYRSPHEAAAKVLLLRDAQAMSPEVQNLLLKVMEEPPDATYFLLTCDNRYRLLSTVLSRMVTVALPPPTDKELLETLLATDQGRAAQVVLQALPGSGYPLLAALYPCEKNRALYSEMLHTVHTMLGMVQQRAQQGISMQQYVRLRGAVETAIKRNESNGYLPVISAALAEQVGRRSD